jgi:EmrB/QacA subfamily drug resistance transporter
VHDLGRPVLAAAAVVVCGAVMTILDTTIVNIAIDRLAVVFDSPLTTVQWVSTAYLLALAAVIPLTGWAVDRFGTRRVFMSAIAVFTLGSILSGAAWSAGTLIAFRVLQGLGGGMVMPVGMTILARAAGQDRMGRVMALVGIPMLLAPAAGPIVGGALVDGATWRLIFFINVPLGALTLALAARVLPRETPAGAGPLDLTGVALLSPGLAALVLGLSGDGAPVALPAGALLIAAFARHALRTEHPLIDLRILADRTVAAATATVLLFSGAFFGSMLLLALYYQLARDLSALDAGLLLLPQAIGAMLTMPVAGKLTDRIGAGAIVLPGLALVVVGTVPFALVARDVPGWLLGIGLVLRGAGMGATLMPAMAAAYQALPPAQVARAASALEIVQRTGASIGIALLALVLEHGLDGRTLSALEDTPAAARGDLGDPMGTAFAWALALTAVAIVPALLLPRRAPVPEPAPA